MVTDLPLPTNESASGGTPVPSPDATGDLSIPSRGSDPEKLKVDEAGESEVDGEEEYDEVRDYFDKLMETDGFADLDRPKGLVCCGVLRALPDRRYRVQECIDFVLKEHNKKPEWGMKLKFSEILWANCSPCSGANYYITFTAADLKTFSKKEKVYEARVYRRRDGTKKTDIFRQKAPSKRVFVKPDRKERLW